MQRFDIIDFITFFQTKEIEFYHEFFKSIQIFSAMRTD